MQILKHCLKTALQKTLVKALNSVSNSSSVLQGRQQLLHLLLSVIEGPPVGINDPGYRPDCLTSRLPGSELYLASRLLQTPSPSNHRPTPDYCSIIDSRGLVFEMILDKPLQSSVRVRYYNRWFLVCRSFFFLSFSQTAHGVLFSHAS